jgi:hypothetical protein
MHDKFVVRDAGTPDGAVWTGSTNFTDDAWRRQENNILVIELPELAALFDTDFGELWRGRHVEGTGRDPSGTVQRGSTTIDVDFAPGGGSRIEERTASLAEGAQRRVLVASIRPHALALVRGAAGVRDEAVAAVRAGSEGCRARLHARQDRRRR